VGVIGGDVAAHAEFGAAIADDDLALYHARRARNRVGLRLVDRHLLPNGLSVGGVERNQTAVDGADIDLAFPQRDAAVHDIAAGGHAARAVDARIECPLAFAGLGV